MIMHLVIRSWNFNLKFDLQNWIDQITANVSINLFYQETFANELYLQIYFKFSICSLG